MTSVQELKMERFDNIKKLPTLGVIYTVNFGPTFVDHNANALQCHNVTMSQCYNVTMLSLIHI